MNGSRRLTTVFCLLWLLVPLLATPAVGAARDLTGNEGAAAAAGSDRSPPLSGPGATGETRATPPGLRAALDATSLEVRGGKLLMAGVANTVVGVDERHLAEVDRP